MRRREAVVTRRRTEEKDLLARRADPVAQDLRKECREPGPAGEHKRVRFDVAARRAKGVRTRGRVGPPIFIARSSAHGGVDDSLHGAARHKHAAFGLIDARGGRFEHDVRKSLPQRIAFEPLETAAYPAERVARGDQVGIIWRGCDQNGELC